MKKIFLLFFLLTLSSLHAAQAVRSYVLIDADRQEVIDAKGIQEIVPLASITKLMTVLVVINSGVDLEEKVTVTGKESSAKIRTGMRMTRNDLVHLSLISSDNLAARTLAETTMSSYPAFIFAMNQLADQLGMSNTNFIEPTGLSVFNVSTPWDIYLLTKETSKHPVFGESAMTKVTEVYTEVKRKVKKVLGMNTNSYAGTMKIHSAKTGYTSPAGRCLTMLIEQNGRRYVIVVMGAKDPTQRKQMVDNLIVEYNKRIYTTQ
jgi:D-alanyl-D-alanine endopeptidase (penicillin-binding protein 7)